MGEILPAKAARAREPDRWPGPSCGREQQPLRCVGPARGAHSVAARWRARCRQRGEKSPTRRGRTWGRCGLPRL